MGIFAARRHAGAAPQDAPLSRGMLMGMLFVVMVMGYLVTTERRIPSFVIGLGAAAGLLTLLCLSLQHPGLPLYAMAAYLPFSKLLAGQFGGLMTAFNLTNIFLVILLAGWFFGAMSSGRPVFEGHPLHLPVLLLMGWGLLSFVDGATRMGNWYVTEYLSEFKRWLDPFIVYFVFFHLVKDRQRWKNVAVILMIVVGMVALMAVREYMTSGQGGSFDRSRVGGIANQPNLLGAFFVYYMFLYAGFWLHRLRRPKAWWLLGPFLLCFRGIMVTFSRGAYLAFGAGCLGLALLRNRLLFLLVCAALAFAAFNPWMLPAGVRYRWESTFKDKSTQITDVYGIEDLESQVDQSAAMRLIVWQGAIQMIGDHPILGVGPGRFPDYIGRYTGSLQYIDAHNSYLITAAEMGVPALAFLILVLLVLAWITRAVYVRTPDAFIQATALGFLGGLSGLVVANVFGSRLNTTEVSGYFWVLAALMARAYQWARKETARQSATAALRRLRVRSMRPALGTAGRSRPRPMRWGSIGGRRGVR